MKLSRNNVRLAIWLIGLGVLWLTNEWWPGILILVGVSMIVDRIMKTNSSDIDTNAPHDPRSGDTLAQKNVNSQDYMDQVTYPDEPIPPPLEKPGQPKLMNLPANCPRCGAPIKMDRNFKDGQYECAFCGSRLVPS